jgi:BatD DUF11 like domain
MIACWEKKIKTPNIFTLNFQFMKQFIFLLTLCSGLSVLAQDAKFTATVSKSTVALNSKFKLEFKLENAQGSSFEAPNFEDFEVVGGPSSSSAMSIVNGTVTQSISYVYYLKPKETGSFRVKSAKIKVNGKKIETDDVEIKVVAEGEQESEDAEEKELQQADPWDGFFQRQMPQQPKEKPKKKRKSYQI